MEQIAAGLKLPVGVVESAGDDLASCTDRGDLATKLVFGSAFLGGEVKEVVFFAVQYVETFVELVADFGV